MRNCKPIAVSGSTSDIARNLAAMTAHGIEVGQVRRRGTGGTIEVLAPGENWPRNGKGLVRCRMKWGPSYEWEESHFWPRTLATYPLVDREAAA